MKVIHGDARPKSLEEQVAEAMERFAADPDGYFATNATTGPALHVPIEELYARWREILRSRGLL